MDYFYLDGVERKVCDIKRRRFCNNQNDSNECANLVRVGRKKATSSLLDAYVLEGEAIPREGELTIVEDWDGNKVCVVKVVDVQILSLSEVSVQHAIMEGDCTLAFWREAHDSAFRSDCEEYDIEYNEERLIVFEVFEVVHDFISNRN